MINDFIVFVQYLVLSAKDIAVLLVVCFVVVWLMLALQAWLTPCPHSQRTGDE